MGTLTNKFINEITWTGSDIDISLPKPGEIHLWRIDIGANLNRLHGLKQLLQPDELQRGDRYHQLKDRQRFVVSRGLLRMILGRYLNQDPAGLSFLIGDNKKPYLATDNGLQIQYNISHSGNWVVLAVALSPVGADLEFIDPDFPFNDILPEHFSEDEIAFINTTDSINRFYLLWTRKEAFLKATGQGLGEHLLDTPSLEGAHELQGHLYGVDKDWNQQSFLIANGYIASIAAAGTWQLRAFDVNF